MQERMSWQESDQYEEDMHDDRFDDRYVEEQVDEDFTAAMYVFYGIFG